MKRLENINERDIQIIRKSLEFDKKSSKNSLIFLVFTLFFMLIVAFFDSTEHENPLFHYLFIGLVTCILLFSIYKSIKKVDGDEDIGIEDEFKYIVKGNCHISDSFDDVNLYFENWRMVELTGFNERYIKFFSTNKDFFEVHISSQSNVILFVQKIEKLND